MHFSLLCGFCGIVSGHSTLLEMGVLEAQDDTVDRLLPSGLASGA